MLNTFGLRSVNRETFNQRYHDTLTYPKEGRDFVVTALRVNNAILNILGYIPFIAGISGCMRIVVGVALGLATIVLGEPEAKQGIVIGRYYSEALETAIGQIGRGILEAFVPYGWIANVGLDVVATPFNLSKEVQGSLVCEGCMGGAHASPHKDADYPLPFWLLYLV